MYPLKLLICKTALGSTAEEEVGIELREAVEALVDLPLSNITTAQNYFEEDNQWGQFE